MSAINVSAHTNELARRIITPVMTPTLVYALDWYVVQTGFASGAGA